MEEWKALPKRKRTARQIESGDVKPLESFKFSIRTVPTHQKLIEENIKNRSTTERASNTIESAKDGASGEYYEYLDHTADVQLHAWGVTLKGAFENIIPCMFNYITDLAVIEIKESFCTTVSGHDFHSLLYAFMDEFLFKFCTDGFICKTCVIDSFDEVNFKISARAEGETYDLTRHVQGTEIKAITYSNMQVHINPERTDLYVIVDI